MAVIFVTFKNVGVRQFDTVQLIPVVSQSLVLFGIQTPLKLGADGDGLFVMNTTLADQVQDNLRNLLLTNHGERLGLYDYGADLIPLVTEFNSYSVFQDEAMVRINTAVTKYMRYLQLDGFAAEPFFEDNRYTGIIKVMVKYSVPAAGINNRVLEVTLRVIG